MKTMRNLFAALILSTVISVSALGGDIMTGVIDTPPGVPTQQNSNSLTSNNSNPSTNTGAEQASIDPVTEALLSLAQSLTALF